MIACADRTLRDRFTARVIEEQSAILSLDKVRALLQGRVPADELEAKAQALLDAAATKRFTAGQSVVIPLEGLSRRRARALRAARGMRTAARATSCSSRRARTPSPRMTARR